MRTEQEIRLNGFDWSNVFGAFLYQDITTDLMREMIQGNKNFKILLEKHLLAGIHQYSKFPSFFYYNMLKYIKAGLAEQKQLKYYADHVYMMYRQQKENEWNASREVYQLVDGNGRILDRYIL